MSWNRIVVDKGHPMAPKSQEDLERYLPSNYRVMAERTDHFLVEGWDDHGWTAEGYVIPRLRSGLIACKITETVKHGRLE